MATVHITGREPSACALRARRRRRDGRGGRQTNGMDGRRTRSRARLDSFFLHSCQTVFVRDLYAPRRPVRTARAPHHPRVASTARACRS
eukprot:31185-Pelagococcus_subviridis.AAC.13